ncbi:TonB-dependent receptor domain-containing protein [Massilia sp. CF038]|uniref:TonB-dependent receptor domain-containing protein n=1 Tax=Massilia sp. CF038 TaxID=1881045 RepID=UPI0009170213|nr:TonB-dependent receptor [Massilia sp. CF038]SHH25180.1 iron complex outermembrane recepter protein [Massilia sp. CF038]
MFKEKIGVRSVRMAIGLLAALAAGQSVAQEAIQRVEITGSSIKRIVKEGALPVQVISKETIARTGATTVADVIQKLPAMQGFTIEAIAAGTNSGGRTTASIHDLGSSYTLVLLNGRRMAPLQDSGSAVNLNSIPMSAIERVEVLTDGASALYGADAIAGVINFILKKNYQGVTLDAGVTHPSHDGGGSSNFTATYGVGDLETNGYNFLVTYRHDDQKQLKAPQRRFGQSAYIPFSFEGRDYIYDRTSVSTSPANVAMTYKAGSGVTANGFNPYFKANNKCADLNFLYLSNTAATQYCSFDFAAQVEIVPESKRDTAYASGRFKLGADTTAFADLSLGRFDLTARIASNPVDVTIPVGSTLYNQYVLPYLTPAQAAAASSATARYRAVDFGTRDSQTITDVKHLVAGIEGSAMGWDYNTALTLSKYEIDERYVGGYMKNTEFRSMLTNRTFDPFATGGQSDATKQLINDSLFKGSIRTASSEMKGIDAHASREVFALPGGMSQIGLGAEYRELQQVQKASTAAKDGTIYAFSAPAENDYTRDSTGVFAELSMPVLSNLEMSVAGRYDKYSKIKDDITHREVGNSQSASTYKLSARYTPIQSVLLRASYGTGFRVADQGSIASPVVAAGFTSGSYTCPPALAAENVALCRAGKEQYNVYSGGNEELSPEKSKQFTMGFRIDASQNVTFGADLWDVKMTNQVSAVSEIQAFADPVKFRQLFSTFTNPATGLQTWAFLRAPINIGRSHNRGIDWDLTVSEKYSFGKLAINANGTYLLKSSYTKPGTDNEWTNSMNFYGINDAVSFRNIVRITPSLDSGNLVNSFSVNYRNGYTDAAANPYSVADKANTVQAIRLKVPSYTTIDYQGKYLITKAWDVRFGVKNLTDKEPPMSLRTSSGHQVGYDPRYADTMGRTMYVNTSYKF